MDQKITMVGGVACRAACGCVRPTNGTPAFGALMRVPLAIKAAEEDVSKDDASKITIQTSLTAFFMFSSKDFRNFLCRS
jgi:hypothetical protein